MKKLVMLRQALLPLCLIIGAPILAAAQNWRYGALIGLDFNLAQTTTVEVEGATYKTQIFQSPGFTVGASGLYWITPRLGAGANLQFFYRPAASRLKVYTAGLEGVISSALVGNALVKLGLELPFFMNYRLRGKNEKWEASFFAGPGFRWLWGYKKAGQYIAPEKQSTSDFEWVAAFPLKSVAAVFMSAGARASCAITPKAQIGLELCYSRQLAELSNPNPIYNNIFDHPFSIRIIHTFSR
jgi:hypothetical protein